MEGWEKTGGAAFPLPYSSTVPTDGMTLRDWFAGQALAPLLAAQTPGHGKDVPKIMAKAAYLVADAMLAERQK